MSDLKLAFHRDIYLEFVVKSGLLVMAEGLGIWEVLKGFVQTYADEKALVFVLGLDPEEEVSLMNMMTAGEDELIGHVAFNILRNETPAKDRLAVYACGGVISITSRILATDMLTDRLPFHLVTGLVVYRAERVTEHCLEAFALYLLRLHNPDSFIQAFSEAPEPFTRGFAQLEKMSRWLQIPNEIYLYPRFHATVKGELDEAKLDAEEVVLRASARTRMAQLALVSLTEACLKELIKSNPGLEAEATMDALLGRQFDVIVRQQLEPVWHQTSFRTRQLVGELSTLRGLLNALFAYDPVTFLRYLENVLETGGGEISWLVLDQANTLIQCSRERVLGSAGPEAPPRWTALLNILKEVEGKRVLIMVESETVRRQVEQLMTIGSAALLSRYLEAYQAHKKRRNTSTSVVPTTTSRWPRRRRMLPSIAKPSQKQVGEDVEDKEEPEAVIVTGDDMNVAFESELVAVRTFPGNGLELLQEMKPEAVIILNQNLAFLRSLELYTCLQSHETPLLLFSLYHQDSTEEQAYLLAVRREKNAFEELIKARAQMVLMAPGQAEADDDGLDALLQARREGRARIDQLAQHKLIVDIRELRSALPFVLHKTGAFNLVPETIAIGDYLLAPECAVERKAIPDLIQSLASGRLYTQTEALCRAYTQPMLLIEFDDSRRAFGLLGLGDLRTDIQGNDLLSRLVLLLIHFPKLRIIWSSSLLATADIFTDLQRDQPDPIPTPSATGTEESNYSLTPKAMLEAMPGVSQQNIFLLMNAFTSVRDLCSRSLDEIQEVIGDNNGTALYNFLHNKFP